MTHDSLHAHAPLETTDLRFLDPRDLRFERHGVRLRLALAGERASREVTVVRVFPLSNPRRYVSVRDPEGKEIGIIVDTRDLDDASRRLVEEELERHYIMPVLRRVLAVRERFGAVDWTVETDRGPRSFMMRNLRESVAQLGPGHYVLIDVDGNRYEVLDVAGLDAVSRGWLARYLV